MKCQLVNKEIKENFLEELLHERGIQNVEEYLNPTEINLLNPDLLENIRIGATILLEVLKKQQTILIIVDCDVDGYSSAAIIYQYIKNIEPDTNIQFLLHEHKQHGLEDLIDTILDSDTQYGLIIQPDSGTNDKVFHNRLAELSTPCLILDHHETDNNDFSQNAIIINNQISPNYLNKDLTGAGITWQFCRYLDQIMQTNYAAQYIDLAALGICGDMGSILSLENNYIMKKGFQAINNPLLQTLIEKQSSTLNNNINPMSIAFYIAPLINAVIRVGTMEEKEHLFKGFIDGNSTIISKKKGFEGQQVLLSEEVLRECNAARNHQNKISEAITKKIEFKIQKLDLLSNKVLFIIAEEDFAPELTGLVAMKLASKYKCPTILTKLTEDGYLRGSARGLNDSALKDLRSFLNQSGLFEYNSGHANAFGSSLPKKNLESFLQYANTELKDFDFNENIYSINFQFQATDSRLNKLIEQIGHAKDIWGTSNPEPLIYITDLHINNEEINIIGKNKDTVQFKKNNITYIKFHAKDLIEEIKNYGEKLKFEIVGKANINLWNDKETPQIIIENYEIMQDSDLLF